VGLHLVCRGHEAPFAVQADMLLLTGGDPAAAVVAWQEQRRAWLGDLAAGRAAPADDPFHVGPVLRIYHGEGNVIDLRTGTIIDGDPADSLLAALPLPAEFAQGGATSRTTSS
jgi:hypothetical protein